MCDRMINAVSKNTIWSFDKQMQQMIILSRSKVEMDKYVHITLRE